ncbi:MAG TPA: PIN domain-containing protein [Thermoanaerobaculia bacterium]|nr:PIN domain-containing protein [Thermoanaerobaculia bacterium]
MAVVLIDTSVWIEVHRGRFDLDAFVEAGEVAICPPIAQELLQGVQSPDLFAIVWETVLEARMLDDPMPLARFEYAAEIYRRCRENGYVIGSSHDCLIAACAIEAHVPLLQLDRDFEAMADVVPLELLRNV